MFRRWQSNRRSRPLEDDRLRLYDSNQRQGCRLGRRIHSIPPRRKIKEHTHQRKERFKKKKVQQNKNDNSLQHQRKATTRRFKFRFRKSPSKKLKKKDSPDKKVRVVKEFYSKENRCSRVVTDYLPENKKNVYDLWLHPSTHQPTHQNKTPTERHPCGGGL